jgi:hypothetical protein
MERCKAETHRPEIVTHANGDKWWRCLDCGEVRPAMEDNK